MAESAQEATGAKMQEFRQQLISHANYLMGRAARRFICATWN